MFKILKNRYLHMLIIIFLMFFVLSSYLHRLTIDEHEKYNALSLGKRIRKVEIPSKRGEISDVKGRPLAYNEVCYSVKLNASLIPQETFAEQCVKMYDFFESQGEKQREFPIFIDNGIYKYQYDEDIRDFLIQSGYDENWSARQVFEYEKSKRFIDKNLSDYEAMNLLMSHALYLPISTIDMKFTKQIEKESFLANYGLDPETPAKQAFQSIRNISYFRIPEEYSDEDAYKVLVYRNLVQQKGYMKYEPIEIVEQASLETCVYVSEQAYDFPGLYTDFTTKRMYTSGDLASHIVGYIGKISTLGEVNYYVDELGYNRNDYVGKTGVEYVMEEKLHGKRGFKYIEADAYGKYIDEVDTELYDLETEKQSRGSSMRLTIDLDFQEKIKKVIESYLKQLQTGGFFENKWGKYKITKQPNAQTAAVCVVDVNSGKIIGDYSYPSFDSMVFMKGKITNEDWAKLNPKNPKNPISARPLIDLTANMAVQPGSTYKMMTSYAAMTQGLDPKLKIFADGYIKMGAHSFGCWLWNKHKGKHGLIDMAAALRESCNYYFYCIASGMDYYKKVPLNFEMNNTILLENSKLFGFDEVTGAEVPQVCVGVPNVERKIETSLVLLARKLEELLPNYFGEELIDTAAKRQKIIDTIVSWAKENPSRGEIIERLYALGSSEDYVLTEEFADIIKYDYFNMMDWYEGDTLNLSIGQGEHAYTPLQMARYTAIIANGGRPIELTYIDSIDGAQYDKNKNVESFDTENYLDAIKYGMYLVTNQKGSYISRVFEKFPITVAGKTGTAEKEGLVPPEDEEAYLYDNLYRIAPEITKQELDIEATKILKLRSEEMAALEKQLQELEESGENDELLQEVRYKFSNALSLERLQKADAMREAIKVLTQNRVDDEAIDKYLEPYGTFSWFVCYAPYDEPEVAISVLVPQGGSGYYAGLLAREVLALYYGLDGEELSEESEQNQ